jgi:hypothetical protein
MKDWAGRKNPKTIDFQPTESLAFGWCELA